MGDDLWTTAPEDFRFVLFDRTDSPQNACRFPRHLPHLHRTFGAPQVQVWRAAPGQVYLVGWLPTLLDDGAVVIMYGRKGSSQRMRILPFASLEAAWPTIRAAVRTRVRHGYRVVLFNGIQE